MKIIEKVLLVLLLLAIIMIPAKINAENYAVFEIKFTVEEPTEGATPATTATVASGSYTGKINISWYESEDGQNWAPMTTTLFENAMIYSPYISLTMNEIEHLLSYQDTSVGGSILYYLNGETFYLKEFDVNFPIGVYNVIDFTLFIDISGDYLISSKKDYTATLTAIDGFKLPKNIEISIGGISLSQDEYTYNRETGKIVVPAEKITGNIEINAKAIPEYTITINQVEGAIINLKDADVKVLEGESVEIEIEALEGYKLVSIKVNNVEQQLVGTLLTINNIKEDINIVVEVEKLKEEVENDNPTAGTTPPIAEPIPPTAKSSESINLTNNPQTGDNILFFAGIFTLSAIAILATSKHINTLKNK